MGWGAGLSRVLSEKDWCPPRLSQVRYLVVEVWFGSSSAAAVMPSQPQPRRPAQHSHLLTAPQPPGQGPDRPAAGSGQAGGGAGRAAGAALRARPAARYSAVTTTRRPRTAKPAHSTLVLYYRNTVHQGGAQSLHSNIFFVVQSRTIKVFCDLNHILPVCDAMIAG